MILVDYRHQTIDSSSIVPRIQAATKLSESKGIGCHQSQVQKVWMPLQDCTRSNLSITLNRSQTPRPLARTPVSIFATFGTFLSEPFSKPAALSRPFSVSQYGHPKSRPGMISAVSLWHKFSLPLDVFVITTPTFKPLRNPLERLLKFLSKSQTVHLLSSCQRQRSLRYNSRFSS